MAVQTVEDLSDYLDQQMARRRKELTDLVLMWRTFAPHTTQERAYRRLVIAMLYAHWEGFVKEASLAYLKHVAGQELIVAQLSFPLRAIAVRKHFAAAVASRKAYVHAAALEAIEQASQQVFEKYSESAIDTESNLSSTVFREIVTTLGFNYLTGYELSEKRLDTNLLKERNKVVHGELGLPPLQETNDLTREIWKKMSSFRTQIEYAAASRRYLAN